MYGPVEMDGPGAEGAGCGTFVGAAAACAFCAVDVALSAPCEGGVLPEGPAAEGGGPSVMEERGKKF